MFSSSVSKSQASAWRAVNGEQHGSPRAPSVNQDDERHLGIRCLGLQYTCCNHSCAQHNQRRHQIINLVTNASHCQINAGLHGNLARGDNQLGVIPVSLYSIPNEGQGTAAAASIVAATSGCFVVSAPDPA